MINNEGDNIYNNDIVRAVKWHRENIGYSSEQLADSLDIHKTTYSKMENFKRNITVRDLILIANTFNMSIDELLTIPKKNSK
ncbi:helix-turn-helix domain-containing protein [Macrococcoides caseolyticum]|uniref:Terminase n=1 Tax=Macrococcoides caseolyticum TaxID=69966 RepID=A0ACC9MR37_9STAP|nr:terminase [Macrococcus caseolyticus]PKE56224.1 terminase [Macrococcus caseolyticus]